MADLGQLADLMHVYHRELGCNVMWYDYTGYGLNGQYGVCSEAVRAVE
jgi:hypothetical protein